MKRSLCALLLTTVFAGVSLAQSGLSFFGIQGKAMIVQRPEVKKELKLTSEQDRAIQNILKQQPSMGVSIGISVEYPTREADEKVSEVLQSEQRLRLHQLFLQSNGELAMRLPEVGVQIGLNDEQQSVIRQIAKKSDADCLELLQQSNGRVNTRQFAQIRSAACAKARESMTPRQLEAWKLALGNEFKFRT